jgi:hypothetical protein
LFRIIGRPAAIAVLLQLKSSLTKLANNYKQTLAPISCS